MARNALSILVVAGVVLVAVVLWNRPTNLGPLPDVELQHLTGASKSVTLADVRGKVTILNFWGTWCPPCRDEFPHIVDLYRAFGDRPDFRLLAVSCDGEHDDDVDALKHATSQFLHQQGTSDFPTYVDRARITREALARVGAFQGVYPTTLIVDRKGIIRGTWVGYRPGAEVAMHSLIGKLLAE
ncbi:MAG TPA: TlpA disulfide reductase family protein [Pirellulales bacterium]|jgi:thiol-disulfide isomerase/thioredoxin|nr:TlpA disulfide reductase family protein [Pirellulales bacterium]